MAVTLTPLDLLQPLGELSNEFFPADDLHDLLDGWLLVATSLIEGSASIDETRHHQAAAAYVYYRAYDYIANQLAALPTQISEGDGAISITVQPDRISYFRHLATAKLHEWQGQKQSVSTTYYHFGVASGRRGCYVHLP